MSKNVEPKSAPAGESMMDMAKRNWKYIVGALVVAAIIAVVLWYVLTGQDELAVAAASVITASPGTALVLATSTLSARHHWTHW